MKDAVFKHYLALLNKWQKAVNLVAPSTLPDAHTRHIEDSLQLSSHIPNGSVVYDLGSGGGFPGLVLALARPDIRVHLIESDTKKCEFLRTVSRETNCGNVTIHNDRLEKITTSLPPPDIITARAFAPLARMLEWIGPWVITKPDITLILLKGENWEDEVTVARQSSSRLFHVEQIPSATNPAARVIIITFPADF